MSISQYYGFVIVAVNLPNGTLDSIYVNGSQGLEKAERGYSVDSGVLLMYQDSPKTPCYTNKYK